MIDLTRKVIGKYYGELYFPEESDYKDIVSGVSKPDPYLLWDIPKVNLISDEKNKSLFFIGDFIGSSDWYGFALKLFIYPDGKALGTVRYVTEAKLHEEKIVAKYEKNKTGSYSFSGDWIRFSEQEYKESFIFYIHPAVIKIENEIKNSSKSSSKKDIVKINNDAKEKVKVTKVIRNDSTNSNKINMDELLQDDFIKLNNNQEKNACDHFLAYILMKLGFTVQLGNSSNGFPDINIQKTDIDIFAYTYASNKKVGSWTPTVNNKTINSYYIFCHMVSKDVFPDIYILKGKKVAAEMKKYGRIDISNPSLIKIKNSWAELN